MTVMKLQIGRVIEVANQRTMPNANSWSTDKPRATKTLTIRSHHVQRFHFDY